MTYYLSQRDTASEMFEAELHYDRAKHSEGIAEQACDVYGRCAALTFRTMLSTFYLHLHGSLEMEKTLMGHTKAVLISLQPCKLCRLHYPRLAFHSGERYMYRRLLPELY